MEEYASPATGHTRREPYFFKGHWTYEQIIKTIKGIHVTVEIFTSKY
jgi:hypothetical protein